MIAKEYITRTLAKIIQANPTWKIAYKYSATDLTHLIHVMPSLNGISNSSIKSEMIGAFINEYTSEAIHFIDDDDTDLVINPDYEFVGELHGFKDLDKLLQPAFATLTNFEFPNFADVLLSESIIADFNLNLTSKKSFDFLAFFKTKKNDDWLFYEQPISENKISSEQVGQVAGDSDIYAMAA